MSLILKTVPGVDSNNILKLQAFKPPSLQAPQASKVASRAEGREIGHTARVRGVAHTRRARPENGIAWPVLKPVKCLLDCSSENL